MTTNPKEALNQWRHVVNALSNGSAFGMQWWKDVRYLACGEEEWYAYMDWVNHNSMIMATWDSANGFTPLLRFKGIEVQGHHGLAPGTFVVVWYP